MPDYIGKLNRYAIMHLTHFGGVELMALIIIVVIAVIIILWWIATYNSLIQLRQQMKNGWAQIDVQLKRRYDLIPNIVETVKGYAKHERETFEKVVKARQMGIDASTVKDQAAAENMITGALRSIFALAEAYPELKANQNFLLLQEELSGTESKIAYARQHYNDMVMLFNTRVQIFPASIVANASGFKTEEFFEIEDMTQREAVKVQF